MNIKTLICILSVLLIGCDYWWEPNDGYVVEVRSSDSTILTSFTISSLEPIQKNLGSVLVFNPYSDTSKYVINNNSKLDTFMMSYTMHVDEEEVSFSDFKFHSRTIKKSKIVVQEYYTFERPFLTVYID